MGLEDTVEKMITQASKEALSAAQGETGDLFDRTTRAFKGEGVLIELSKSLGVDCTEFFSDATVAVGTLRGLQQRLQGEMHKETGDTLSQTASFTLVDLHGRVLGLEAMVHQIGGLLESARTQRISESSVRARMGAVFLMLEECLAEAMAELSKRGASAGVAAAVDGVAARLRAQRSGPYQTLLMRHLDELPA